MCAYGAKFLKSLLETLPLTSKRERARERVSDVLGLAHRKRTSDAPDEQAGREEGAGVFR